MASMPTMMVTTDPEIRRQLTSTALAKYDADKSGEHEKDEVIQDIRRLPIPCGSRRHQQRRRDRHSKRSTLLGGTDAASFAIDSDTGSADDPGGLWI